MPAALSSTSTSSSSWTTSSGSASGAIGTAFRRRLQRPRRATARRARAAPGSTRAHAVDLDPALLDQVLKVAARELGDEADEHLVEPLAVLRGGGDELAPLDAGVLGVVAFAVDGGDGIGVATGIIDHIRSGSPPRRTSSARRSPPRPVPRMSSHISTWRAWIAVSTISTSLALLSGCDTTGRDETAQAGRPSGSTPRPRTRPRPATTRRPSSSTSGSKAAPPARCSRSRRRSSARTTSGRAARRRRRCRRSSASSSCIPTSPALDYALYLQGLVELQRQPRPASAASRARIFPSATSRPRATRTSRSAS